MQFTARNFDKQIKSSATYRRDLKRLWRQARHGGIGFELIILRRERMETVLRTLPDDDRLRAFVLTLRSWFCDVGAGAKSLCLTCRHEFQPETVVDTFGGFVMLRPVHAAPSTAGIGICASCCDSHSDAELVAAAKKFTVECGLADEGVGSPV
jgi:hypothetical protein